MNYPLISEYIEAIKAAEDNFDELTNLRAVLGDDGQPVMTSGNFAVVFKMKDVKTGKLYALKCFTKEQEGRAEAYHQIAEELKDVDLPYLVSIRFLEKELFVDTEQTDETEFPVLLMDWVEGKTLDKYLRENLDDKYALEMLAYRFSQLAQWLIPQPFAHGDLKPDNILVREDGTLVLVDYDGMYVPAMKGQKARELGSPDFRHPLRTGNDFDEHTDDYSFAMILFILRTCSINPLLCEESCIIDSSTFPKIDNYYIGKYEFQEFLLFVGDSNLNSLYGLLVITYLNINLVDNQIKLFSIEKPLSGKYTIVMEVDMANSWIDNFGAVYSEDGKKLLKGPAIVSYRIKEGTKIICNKAFDESDIKEEKSLFSEWSLSDGKKEGYIKRKKLRDNAYDELGINEYVNLFSELSSAKDKDDKFEGERTNNSIKEVKCLRKISIPNSVELIGDEAFKNCKHLKEVVLPDSVQEIGEDVFGGCTSLEIVKLSNSMEEVKSGTFYCCYELKTVIFPPSIKRLCRSSFLGCENMIHIPPTIQYIEGNIGCMFTIDKNSAYLCIKDNMVMNKERTILYGILTHYSHDDGQNDVYLENKPKIAKSLTPRHEYDWEDYLYYEDGYTVITSPRYIENIDFTIPHTITTIGEYAFCGIDFIRHLVIPKSVTSIGRGAFAKCNFEVLRILKSDLKIDSSIFNDGDISFDGCYIEVPKGCKKVYKAMLLDLPDINLFDYVIESQ